MKIKPMNTDDKLDVMFCLPGNNFSGRFLDCWTGLILHCINQGISFGISRAESPCLPHVRNLCLSGNPHKGRDQKILDGVEVKKIFWVDSDIIFSPAQFDMLYKSDKEVITGFYMMAGQTGYACWEKLDENYFKVHGTFKSVKPDDIKDKTEPFEVEYCGMGFMCMDPKVFDDLRYPWFKLMEQDLGRSYELSFEDYKFCKDLLKHKHKIYAHPQVIVGHEKKVVL